MAEYHHRDLRRALLKTARQMVVEGEEGFSLRAVARRAGVSPGAPYHHFPDRRHLLAALAVQGFRELDAALERACRRLTSPESILTTSCTTYFEFAVAHAGHYRVMFSSDYRDDADFAEYNQVARRSFATLCSKVAAIQPKRRPQAVARLSMALWSMAHGMATLYIDGTVADPKASQAARELGRLSLVLAREG